MANLPYFYSLSKWNLEVLLQLAWFIPHCLRDPLHQSSILIAVLYSFVGMYHSLLLIGMWQVSRADGNILVSLCGFMDALQLHK